ncbi:hypothetical protein [Saccharibacillus sp. JS10]|uniref:hypothetical protein n=1 Tax=Saccharibacillus sp. JS10 TaxID=2950552 RepID=UPI00210ED27D|nr:hypothetical protein [Saccharibacillus sp. JS10]MCQ4085439.1 hypothetical protein [Saccharibacillus sp. JS10]
MNQTLYEKLLSMDNEVEQFLTLYHKLHANYSKEARQRFDSETVGFSHESLILLKACSQIGLTGFGEIYFSDDNNDQQISSYSLFIEESAEDLLKRYVLFYVFCSREELLDHIARYIEFSESLEKGLSLLKSLQKPATSLQLEAGFEELVLNTMNGKADLSFTQAATLVVAMDYSNGKYIYFEFREDVAHRIEELRTEFYDWMYTRKGIQPFRIDRFALYQGEIVDKGWYYIQSHHDFVNWINVMVYKERVGRKKVDQSAQELIAMISF